MSTLSLDKRDEWLNKSQTIWIWNQGKKLRCWRNKIPWKEMILKWCADCILYVLMNYYFDQLATLSFFFFGWSKSPIFAFLQSGVLCVSIHWNPIYPFFGYCDNPVLTATIDKCPSLSLSLSLINWTIWICLEGYW